MTINSKQTYHIELEISKDELYELKYIADTAHSSFCRRFADVDRELTEKQRDEAFEYVDKVEKIIIQLDRILRGE